MPDQVNIQEVMSAVEDTRIIAILRGDLRGRSLDVARILLEAGIRVIEVTMNSPGVLDTISRLEKEFRGQIVLGAGTVRTCAEVAAAQDCGARFIVSPNTNPVVIQMTRERGMASFPGAFTCSEIIQAFDAGASAVKLFPMVDASPRLVHALRSPLGDVKLIPTGGVTCANADDYLRAGAFGLGIGSELVGAETPSDAGLAQLRISAGKFAAIAKPFRAASGVLHV